MPTYEYQCKSCGNRFDLVQKIGEPPPPECPECQGGPITKVFSAVGIIFKGSGFYVTDYRKEKPPAEGGETKQADGDAKSDKTSGDSPSGTTDSASATSESSTKNDAAPKGDSGSSGDSSGTKSETSGTAATPPKPTP